MGSDWLAQSWLSGIAGDFQTSEHFLQVQVLIASLANLLGCFSVILTHPPWYQRRNGPVHLMVAYLTPQTPHGYLGGSLLILTF